LFDVLGAREYREGANRDPASVGVRALDGLTLEVRLEQPVAYFPYIITMPVTFPLPRKIIEDFGKTWWQPGTFVGNGPYRLERFDPQHGVVLKRNSGYYGDFPGNAEQVEWTIFPQEEDLVQAYIEGRIEYAFYGNRKVPGVISREEIHENQQLGVFFLVFSPTEAPFNDVRVRKAFGLTFNRQRFFDQFTMPICRGGLVPPGMPGHSPDINLPYDVTLARRLMSEAGYPGGEGFPAVKGIGPQGGASRFAELVRQWREALGVEIVLEETALGNLTDWKKENASHILVMNGWQADYPDPDNILWKSDAIDQLKRLGWHDPAYDRLVEEASRTPDRVKRLAMYRQADRLLVAEQAFVLPIFYFLGRELIKPWVKNYRENLLGMVYLHQLIIQDH
jgi:oligopeptide transport system substrate-binding protein